MIIRAIDRHNRTETCTSCGKVIHPNKSENIALKISIDGKGSVYLALCKGCKRELLKAVQNGQSQEKF